MGSQVATTINNFNVLSGSSLAVGDAARAIVMGDRGVLGENTLKAPSGRFRWNAIATFVTIAVGIAALYLTAISSPRGLVILNYLHIPTPPSDAAHP